MKILLSGAQGFLGRRVLDFLLEENLTVRVLVRRPAPELEKLGLEVVLADLREAEATFKALKGIDGVIHCAAKSGIWGDLDDYIQANTLSSLNLLNAARKNGAGCFIHTSSPSVVHTGRPLAGLNEDAPYIINPKYGYPYSKMLAEKIVLGANDPSFITTALRPHLIWGPGDPHFLPRLKAKAKAGRLILLKSEALVDGTFIDNAAWAHVLAVKKMLAGQGRDIGGRAYFIAQGEPLTVVELIEKILSSISGDGDNLKIKALLPPRLGYWAAWSFEAIWNLFKIKEEPPLTSFVAEELSLPHWFDLSRAKTELGYKPIVSLQEGLEKLKKAKQ